MSDIQTTQTTLTSYSDVRKGFPLYRGLLRYFPAALASVAHISKIGNDKHNPGEVELRHARGKSMDHADCILRHLVDLEEDFGHGKGYDEKGEPQVAYIAWRALALAQEWLEKEGAPMAPAATVEEPQPQQPSFFFGTAINPTKDDVLYAVDSVRAPRPDDTPVERAVYASKAPF